MPASSGALLSLSLSGGLREPCPDLGLGDPEGSEADPALDAELVAAVVEREVPVQVPALEGVVDAARILAFCERISGNAYATAFPALSLPV